MKIATRLQHRRSTRGFTLVELMVVIAILGLLAGVVAFNVMGQAEKAYKGRVQADFASIKKAIDLFKLDVKRYPQQLSELWERPANASNWGPEPYLSEYPPKDPWDQEYIYNYTGGRDYEILTYGADQAPGGEADAADLSSKTINDGQQQ